MNLFSKLLQSIRIETVSAHCDVPCGIYDPISAKIAAQTVLKMAVRLEAVDLPPTDICLLYTSDAADE